MQQRWRCVEKVRYVRAPMLAVSGQAARRHKPDYRPAISSLPLPASRSVRHTTWKSISPVCNPGRLSVCATSAQTRNSKRTSGSSYLQEVSMSSVESLRALSQALRLETEGLAFYLQAATETIDPKGKALFASLADDERKHQEMIRQQLHAVEG